MSVAAASVGRAFDRLKVSLEAGEREWANAPEAAAVLAVSNRHPGYAKNIADNQTTSVKSLDGPCTVPSGERRILTALAQYPEGRSKAQVAILAGYALNGGGFNNYLGALRSRGLIKGDGDRLTITDAGIEALGSWQPLPTGSALVDYWRSRGKAERLILETLAQAYPEALTKEEVALKAGYEPSGGGFNNALGRLRTLELVQGRGELQASDNLYDAG